MLPIQPPPVRTVADSYLSGHKVKGHTAGLTLIRLSAISSMLNDHLAWQVSTLVTGLHLKSFQILVEFGVARLKSTLLILKACVSIQYMLMFISNSYDLTICWPLACRWSLLIQRSRSDCWSQNPFVVNSTYKEDFARSLSNMMWSWLMKVVIQVTFSQWSSTNSIWCLLSV